MLVEAFPGFHVDPAAVRCVYVDGKRCICILQVSTTQSQDIQVGEDAKDHEDARSRALAVANAIYTRA